jgi:hypothetical protein
MLEEFRNESFREFVFVENDKGVAVVRPSD